MARIDDPSDAAGRVRRAVVSQQRVEPTKPPSPTRKLSFAKDELSAGKGGALRRLAKVRLGGGGAGVEPTGRTFKAADLISAASRLQLSTSHASASSLHTEVLGDGQANCLERAVGLAKPGDSIVMLADTHDRVGHAVVEHPDGTVLDPNTPDHVYRSMKEFQLTNPRYTDPVRASSEAVKQVLSTPVGAAREQKIKELGLDRAAAREVADPAADPVVAAQQEVDDAQKEVEAAKGTSIARIDHADEVLSEAKAKLKAAKMTQAAEEVKTAQQAVNQAKGSNNHAQIEHTDEALASAQAKLKGLIDDGAPLTQVNADYAARSKDPVDRVLVAEATADLAREKADQHARDKGLTANQEGREDQDPDFKNTQALRTVEGQTRKQLAEVADQSVSDLRGQGMSRDQALATVRAAAGSSAQDVVGERSGVPNTLGLSQAEKAATYQKIFQDKASPEAKAAYERGERVVLGLRHDTTLDDNGGKGKFDDRMVVMWKDKDGTAHVKEYEASLDPNTQYGDNLRDPYPTRRSSGDGLGPYASYEQHPAPAPHPGDPPSDGTTHQVQAWSRVASGQTIRMQTGPDGRLYPPPGGGYQIEGDVNGDGVFNDGPEAVRQENGNGFEMHGSAWGHTGSGGCMTVPTWEWNQFHDDLFAGKGNFDPVKDPQGIYLTVV